MTNLQRVAGQLDEKPYVDAVEVEENTSTPYINLLLVDIEERYRLEDLMNEHNLEFLFVEPQGDQIEMNLAREEDVQ